MIANTGYEIGENPKLRDGTIIYPHTKMGNNFQTGHYTVIREYTTIGDNCSVGTHTEIGHHVKIGNNVRIHSNCFIPEYTEIADDVWIGPYVCITNTLHPKLNCSKDCSKRTRVIIRNGAIIGASVTILPGVIIGKDSLIGAGSLIAKDTEDGFVYYNQNYATKWCQKEDLKCKFKNFLDNNAKSYK